MLPSISSSWRRLSKRTHRIIIGGIIVVLLLTLWLVWPMISEWRARHNAEAARIATDATAVQANNEAQQMRGQLQQLQSDFNSMKADYEQTKQQITTLQNDLAAAQAGSQRATIVYQQTRERQKAYVPRRDAGSLSDDTLRRDASAAAEAIKP